MAWLQIPKLTEWIIAKGKATQWLDRDQPEIVAEEFQLPPALVARFRKGPSGEISRSAEAIGASSCLRQPAGAASAPELTPMGPAFYESGLQRAVGQDHR
jgi:hypothetical protein